MFAVMIVSATATMTVLRFKVATRMYVHGSLSRICINTVECSTSGSTRTLCIYNRSNIGLSQRKGSFYTGARYFFSVLYGVWRIILYQIYNGSCYCCGSSTVTRRANEQSSTYRYSIHALVSCTGTVMVHILIYTMVCLLKRYNSFAV